jgi:hypothetical protein
MIKNTLIQGPASISMSQLMRLYNAPRPHGLSPGKDSSNSTLAIAYCSREASQCVVPMRTLKPPGSDITASVYMSNTSVPLLLTSQTLFDYLDRCPGSACEIRPIYGRTIEHTLKRPTVGDQAQETFSLKCTILMQALISLHAQCMCGVDPF